MIKKKTPDNDNQFVKQVQYDVGRTLNVIEEALSVSLNTDVPLTPEALCELMEMFITLLYLRKVTLDYWIECAPTALRGFALAQRIQAEANLLVMEGLPAKAYDTIRSAMDLSVKEIKAVRTKLLARVEVLTKMPDPTKPLH